MTRMNAHMVNDPKPRKITLVEWSRQFRQLDESVIRQFTYYENPEWGIYLSPPATFMVYGAKELKRLKMDNSLAALRLWGFVFNESERLYRARQIGRKVVATMGDLGIVPTLVMAFPNCVPFYPECIWWTPFFRESKDLLNTSTMLGIPEGSCFVRAALAAFYKKAYFPRPDLLIGSTGASCDDYSGVMQMVEELGHEILWVEIPFRKSARAEEYLTAEYERILGRMRQLTGVTSDHGLAESIKKANRLRRAVGKLKQLCYTASAAPLPALELMTIEFGNMYGYGDFDEWTRIVEAVVATVEKRVGGQSGVLDAGAVPIAWISPSADPYVLNLVEDLGCRVVATEYVINQALVEIEEDIEPVRALARAFLQASLIGSTEDRVRRIREQVEAGTVRGVLITNSMGASHCAMETRLIEKMLGRVPVLSIDIPEPFGITEQIRTRLEAFVEMIG